MMFLNQCAPNHMLIHKDGTLTLDNGHLKFEAILLINQL